MSPNPSPAVQLQMPNLHECCHQSRMPWILASGRHSLQAPQYSTDPACILVSFFLLPCAVARDDTCRSNFDTSNPFNLRRRDVHLCIGFCEPAYDGYVQGRCVFMKSVRTSLTELRDASNRHCSRVKLQAAQSLVLQACRLAAPPAQIRKNAASCQKAGFCHESPRARKSYDITVWREGQIEGKLNKGFLQVR